MCDNYEHKLLEEIMKAERKLSASIYHNAKNVGIIGILAYPKKWIISVFKREALLSN